MMKTKTHTSTHTHVCSWLQCGSHLWPSRISFASQIGRTSHLIMFTYIGQDNMSRNDLFTDHHPNKQHHISLFSFKHSSWPPTLRVEPRVRSLMCDGWLDVTFPVKSFTYSQPRQCAPVIRWQSCLAEIVVLHVGGPASRILFAGGLLVLCRQVVSHTDLLYCGVQLLKWSQFKVTRMKIPLTLMVLYTPPATFIVLIQL